MSDTSTNGVGAAGANAVTSDTTISTQTLQLRFAVLQLSQARACRNTAEEYVQKLKDSQAASKECSNILNLAYGARTNNPDDKGKKGSKPSQEIINYCKNHNISLPAVHDGGIWNYNEWDVAIKAITNYQEQLSSSSQTDMVYLQDFMGQYNSYNQGAAKAGTDVSALLKSILTR